MMGHTTFNPWLPIDCAPKDGTSVWLFFPDGYWRSEKKEAIGFWSDTDWYEDESDSSSMTAFGSHPTLWKHADVTR